MVDESAHGCFCYLVNHTEAAIADACKSLRLLNVNYLAKYPTKVILFHESELSNNQKQLLVSSVADNIEFQEVTLYPPVGTTEFSSRAKLGYMNMCHFFANDVFWHPALSGYDYYCRLDTDSFILSPVKYNIFSMAAKKQIIYGYINDSQYDLEWCSAGLWPLSEQYLKSHNDLKVHCRLYTDILERRLFYTNYELCNIKWFQNEPWVSFFKYIDEDGGIYRNRWGDHIIRYIGVKLFADPKKVIKMYGIHYSHQDVVDNVPLLICIANKANKLKNQILKIWKRIQALGVEKKK